MNTQPRGKRILIIGGVAGGASCAARLRRLDESASITMLDKGAYVSFANCGLPYHVGGVIPEESSLVLATPESFKKRFRIDVRTGHEALRIDRTAGAVAVREPATGREYTEEYDFLVLSPGASPLRPPIPGLDLPGVFTVRTIPDARVIREWIERRGAGRAIVAGGGFIGLEMAENLRHRGLDVTVLEMAPQVLPPLDAEIARPMEEHLRAKGIRLLLGEALARVSATPEGALLAETSGGQTIPADLLISALGVRPDSSLAGEAGLALGQRGGIRVDAQMRTEDPRIFAVGDAVEVLDSVLGIPAMVALAGPASRQGRVVADVICGLPSEFRGVQATAICGVFGMAAATTGATEKSLARAGVSDFETIHIHPKNHVAYYPGAEFIHMKVIFRKSDGLLLGAQAVGLNDVARKIDVLASMIQMKGSVRDLAEAELCYAPQFGASKDAVNFAGMVASNALDGLLAPASWSDADPDHAFLLDVREPWEFEGGHARGAVNIPVGQLRDRLSELPQDRPILAYCQVGQRGYLAQRILSAHGLDAKNLSGGWFTALASGVSAQPA